MPSGTPLSRQHAYRQTAGRMQGKGAVVLHIEGANDAPTRVVDVQNALIGRECQAVGRWVRRNHSPAESGCPIIGYAEDAGNGLLQRRSPQRLRDKSFAATGATWIPVVSGTGLHSNSTAAT